jgi:hypothetical protein
MLAGPASVSGMMAGGVTVLDRKTVGIYETVTISGADGKKIGDWLNSNGFKVSAGEQEALAQYAKEGWVFVAGRLRRESSADERFRACPLSFTFAASRAVYPLRLTGIGNGPVSVDLYVAANEEAVAAPFTRQRAGRLDFGGRGNEGESIPVSHKALQSYCNGFSALTLLSATLSPAEMRDDVYLGWKPLVPFRRVYFMSEAALLYAWHVASAAFLLISIGCAVAFRRRFDRGPALWKSFLVAVGIALGLFGAFVGFIVTGGEGITGNFSFPGVSVLLISVLVLVICFRLHAVLERQISSSGTPQPMPSVRLVLMALVASVLLGGCLYLALPIAPETEVIELSHRAPYRPQLDLQDLLVMPNVAEGGGGPAELLAACRKEAASILAGGPKGERQAARMKNPFTGQPYREEDSPGNYVIELKEGKPTLFCFDEDGRKVELGAIGVQMREHEW